MGKSPFSFPKEHNEAIRIVREEIPGEAQKKAEILAKGLIRYFVDFKYDAPYWGNGIILNEAILKQTTIAFFEDIIRLRTYHPINNPSKYKYAAFIFKWISKCRPIKILTDHANDYSEYYTRANAIFAIHCALAFLKCTPPDEVQMREIIYSATFRSIHPEQWALTFYYMEKANFKDKTNATGNE